MADQPDPFAADDAQVHTIQRANGAETLFDAVEQNQGFIRLCHRIAREPGAIIHVGFDRRERILLGIRLATPPLGMVSSAASKLSWVKAR